MDEAWFIGKALGDQGNAWNSMALATLATQNVPDAVLGPARNLLRGDINGQWARWFVESLGDPWRYVHSGSSYPRVFSDVYEVVQCRFPNWTQPQQRALAAACARALNGAVERLKVDTRRSKFSFSEKRLLLDLAGSPPRCWICGGHFPEGAVDSFLGHSGSAWSTPEFLDILKPRGLRHQDHRVEIDHVLAHAEGGGKEEPNLELACGWCNRHKGALSSVYDVEGRALPMSLGKIGIESAPRPFWVIRFLALRQRCEHPAGCERATNDCPMTVAPINLSGSMNPANLMVCCYEHDPLSEVRLQPRRVIERAWAQG